MSINDLDHKLMGFFGPDQANGHEKALCHPNTVAQWQSQNKESPILFDFIKKKSS